MIGARVLALSLALASPLRAQTGVVSLLVLDDATDSAVPGVRVSVVGQDGEGVTDEGGRFMYVARHEIDAAHASRMTDLLRRTMSLTVEDSAGAVIVLARRSGRMAKCPMQLGVDGELRYGFNLNTLVPEDVHGIEIYPGPATVPAEFASMRGTSRCGLIMVWTRRDK